MESRFKRAFSLSKDFSACPPLEQAKAEIWSFSSPPTFCSTNVRIGGANVPAHTG